MPTIQPITAELLERLLNEAYQSTRLRAIHCFHEGDWEHCHRMINALAVGTYVRPHRHADQHQSEGFILLRGKMAVLIFTQTGQIDFETSRMLSAASGNIGLNLAPGIWHSLVCLEDSVIYEVKGHPLGGYVAERDKDFAPWAPPEGASEASAYLLEMEKAAKQIQ